MTEFATPIQSAIYARLTAAMPARRIYDDVPNMQDGAPAHLYPYIVIGEDTFRPWDNDDTVGNLVYINLHVWSRYQGKKEVKEILDEIYTALNRQHGNLSASGYYFLDCLFDWANVFDEDDGATRHGVCRYKLVIQKE